MEPTPRKLLNVGRERPVQAGWFKLNYQLGWGAGAIALSLLAIIYSSSIGNVLPGLAVAVVIMLITGMLISVAPGTNRPLVSILYRSGSRRAAKTRGHHKHNSGRAETGEVFGVAEPRKVKIKPIKQIGRVEFFPHEYGNSNLGVAHDHTYNTWTSRLWAAAESLENLDEAARRRRLEAFGFLLDTICRMPIYRFAWHEQTIIGEPNAENLIDTLRTSAGLNGPQPNLEIALRRINEGGEDSIIHRTTYDITISGKHQKADIKAMGGEAQALVQQLKQFLSAATNNSFTQGPLGINAASFLTYNNIVIENRLVLDPVFGQRLWQEWQGPVSDNDLLGEYVAWPNYCDLSSPHVAQIGETYHKGFYIEDFTRTGMPPRQFDTIVKLKIPKTISVVYEMVPPRLAERRATWSATGVTSANLDRAKTRRVTASQEVLAQTELEHEQEIAHNVGQVGRLRCYIDVTGASEQEADANAAQLRNAGRDARFVIEPLTGRQEDGIAVLMPAGRGLASMSLPEWLTN